MSAPWYRLPACFAHMCHAFRFAGDEHGCWGECSICHKRVGYVDRATLRRAADAEADRDSDTRRMAETGTGSTVGDSAGRNGIAQEPSS